MCTRRIAQFCFLFWATAICPASGLGQDEPANDESSNVTRTKLIEIAKDRVAQHEQRLKAIRALGKLRQEINEVQVRQVKSEVESIKAEFNAAEVVNRQQQRELERIEQLVEKAAAPQSELSEIQIQVATSVARLAQARSKLKLAEANVHAATLELEQAKWEFALQEAEATIELLNAKAVLVELQAE